MVEQLLHGTIDTGGSTMFVNHPTEDLLVSTREQRQASHTCKLCMLGVQEVYPLPHPIVTQETKQRKPQYNSQGTTPRHAIRYFE